MKDMASGDKSNTKEPPRPRYTRTFLAEWREKADLTQQELADGMGFTKGHISHLELGTRPYGQGVLERAVAVLCAKLPGLTVADLIAFNPANPATMSLVDWARRIPPAHHEAAAAMLEGLARRAASPVTPVSPDAKVDGVARKAQTP